MEGSEETFVRLGAASEVASARSGAPLLACNVWLEEQIRNLSDPNHCRCLYGPWRERYLALRGHDPADPKRSFRMAVKGCLKRLAESAR